MVERPSWSHFFGSRTNNQVATPLSLFRRYCILLGSRRFEPKTASRDINLDGKIWHNVKRPNCLSS